MNRTEEILNKQREYFATGATLNISSGDVTNKATYIAQLERGRQHLRSCT